jgi:hypothetical protein
MPNSAMWQCAGRHFEKILETFFFIANELFELPK